MDKLLELPREELIKIASSLGVSGRERLSNRELAETIYRRSLEMGVSSFLLQNRTGDHIRVEYNNIALPMEIGRTRACLLYRDPVWAFLYWEITREMLPDGDAYCFSLHVCDAATHERYLVIDDVERVGRWYININAPDREFYVRIGTTDRSGRFVELVRSNIMHMPFEGIDTNPVDRYRVYDASTGQFRDLPATELPSAVRTGGQSTEGVAGDRTAQSSWSKHPGGSSDQHIRSGGMS